jgi:hypothetical protein
VLTGLAISTQAAPDEGPKTQLDLKQRNVVSIATVLLHGLMPLFSMEKF